MNKVQERNMLRNQARADAKTKAYVGSVVDDAHALISLLKQAKE